MCVGFIDGCFFLIGVWKVVVLLIGIKSIGGGKCNGVISVVDIVWYGRLDVGSNIKVVLIKIKWRVNE